MSAQFHIAALAELSPAGEQGVIRLDDTPLDRAFVDVRDIAIALLRDTEGGRVT